jgi:hypothetical protein
VTNDPEEIVARLVAEVGTMALHCARDFLARLLATAITARLAPSMPSRWRSASWPDLCGVGYEHRDVAAICTLEPLCMPVQRFFR